MSGYWIQYPTYFRRASKVPKEAQFKNVLTKKKEKFKKRQNHSALKANFLNFFFPEKIML